MKEAALVGRYVWAIRGTKADIQTVRVSDEEEKLLCVRRAEASCHEAVGHDALHRWGAAEEHLVHAEDRRRQRRP